MSEGLEPNAEQVEYWSQVAGPRWVALHAQLDAQIRGLGVRAQQCAQLAPGDAVIDVGCGCGDSTLEIARSVGPRGHVTGVDVSGPMLERARERAREAGLSNLRFLEADAQTCSFAAGGADVVYSRFGVMFFAQPEAAFANLRRALVPGGRLAFVCWQALAHNPWMLVPLAAAASEIQLPPPPPPLAPGPFAFADAGVVRGVLESAGFEAVELEPAQESLVLGGERELERAVEFILQVGPAAAALREAGEPRRERVARAVREALRPHATPEGVRLAGAAWLVTARAPA